MQDGDEDEIEVEVGMLIRIVQGSELVSSFVARRVMHYAFEVDVTQVGLDEMREYPELGE
jgi:hypothetical protein